MNISKMGWTMTIDGEDLYAEVNIADGDDASAELIDSVLRLLTKQRLKTIVNYRKAVKV